MKVMIEVPENTIGLGIDYVYVVEDGEKKGIEMGGFGMNTREIYENVIEPIEEDDIQK